jgi:hypothetical protein
MAIADGALYGYKTLADVQAQEIPKRDNELILRFHDSALEQPILRNCTKKDGMTDQPMARDAFSDIFRKMLLGAGYFCSTLFHAIRRQLGKRVDGKSAHSSEPFYPGSLD